MAKNWLLLGSVAFGVSFALSLLINRDIKPALISGLITVPATFSGVFFVNRKQRIKEKQTLTALQSKIYQLERRETQINQTFRAIAAEEQRTKSNINFLKTELSPLYTQIAEQRSYKQQLNQDLITLSERKEQLEADSRELQTQIHNYEQRKRELREFMQFMKAEKQDAEAKFNSMQFKLKQLQVQVTEQQKQNEELEQNLVALNQVKPQLEATLHNLQNQINDCEIQKTELDLSLSALAQDRYITEANIKLLQSQLNYLQTQIAEQQKHKDELEQDLIILSQQKQQLEAKQNKFETIPNEWIKFVMRLNKPELQVLKAIIQQSKPSAAIKKIAEENITMPELLIDAINECALDTIGDLIIEPESELMPPGILEEYLTNLNKVINIKNLN